MIYKLKQEVKMVTISLIQGQVIKRNLTHDNVLKNTRDW